MANTAMERRYSLMRQQLAEQEGQARGQEVEALRRRFASLGALGSGAAIKTEQKATDASQRRLQQGYGQLDVARLAEEQGLEESEKQRQFAAGEAEKQRGWGTTEAEKQRGWGTTEAEKQRGFMTGERVGGQEFLSNQNELQRKYATSERLAGQEFLSGENLAQRKFAQSEREAGQTFQSALVDKQLKSQLENLLKQISLQKEIFQKEFDLNKEIAYFNMGKNPPMKLGVDLGAGMDSLFQSGSGNWGGSLSPGFSMSNPMVGVSGGIGMMYGA